MLVYLFMWKTSFGYKMRASGAQSRAARYGGINVPAYVTLAMVISGAFAGLAGGIEIAAVHRRAIEGVTNNYGFSAVVVALFGMLHPFGIVPASFFFALLIYGSTLTPRAVGVPANCTDASVHATQERRLEMDLIINILSMTVPFSVALLLASIGEMFNQRSGVFNLGCEGVMAMGAFLGMLVPFLVGHGGPVSNGWNWLGLLLAALVGALLGLFFGVIVVTFRAPQGIAGIGLQMFGVGTAGTLFRHFVVHPRNGEHSDPRPEPHPCDRPDILLPQPDGLPCVPLRARGLVHPLQDQLGTEGEGGGNAS